jgi:hypothetical protein
MEFLKNKKTHKTEAILKLLTSGSRMRNPMIEEKYKEDVPIIPVEEEKKAYVPARVYHPGEEIDLDIIKELANELLPSAITRFSCCKCSRCYAEMLSETLEKSPHARVKIRSNDDFLRAEYLKNHHRNAVLRVVVSVAIKFRTRKKHVTPIL